MLTPRYNQVSISEDSRTPHGAQRIWGLFQGPEEKNTCYLQPLGLSDWKNCHKKLWRQWWSFSWAPLPFLRWNLGQAQQLHQSCSGKKKNPNKTPIEIINTASGKLLHLTKNPKTAKDLSVKTLHGLSPATEPGEQLLQNSLCFARIHQYSCPLISRASD